MDVFQNIFIWCLKVRKKSCCTNQLLSVVWAPIEIPCYFGPDLSRFFGAIFSQNNMGCQWKPIKLTVIGQCNMAFWNHQGPNENILKKKSIFFTALLKSKFQVACQPTKRGHQNFWRVKEGGTNIFSQSFYCTFIAIPSEIHYSKKNSWSISAD